MRTFLLFLLFIFSYDVRSAFDREKCLIEGRSLIIASSMVGKVMLYESDAPVGKFAENYCNCLEKNTNGPREKNQELCQKDAGVEFKKSFSELVQTLSKKESIRRGMMVDCLQKVVPDFSGRLEQSPLKTLRQEEKLVVFSNASLETCECITQYSVEVAFKGLEDKKDFSKEEKDQMVMTLKTSLDSPEGKKKNDSCIQLGRLLMPVSAITAYDNPQVYLQECVPIVAQISFGSEQGHEMVKKYAEHVCQCAHPKIKGNETRVTIARLCHEDAVRALGEAFMIDRKKTYRENFRKNAEISCMGNKDLVNHKIDSSSLRTLKTESRERLIELVMDPYCKCSVVHEIENAFKGISDSRTLSPEEEKLLKTNRSEYEKSYKRHKNNETCADESLINARKKLAEELRTKSK